MHSPHQGEFRKYWAERSRLDRWAITALVAVSILEIIATITLRPSGFDFTDQYVWIDSWHKMWQQGVFYPRWLPDSFNGFGAPSFYFYPPLCYAISSLLYLLLPTFSVAGILKVELLLFSGLSFIVSRWYLRNRGISRYSAVLGAVLYTFVPYRFFDVQIRNSLAEHAAFILIPIVFWGAEQILKQTAARRNVAALAIGLGILLLTNLPSAVITGVALFALMVAYRANGLRPAMIVSASASIGILLAAFWWVAVPSAKPDAQLDLLWKLHDWKSGFLIVELFTGQGLASVAYGLLSLAGAIVLLISQRNKEVGPFAKFVKYLLCIVVICQIPYLTGLLFQSVFPFNIIQIPWRLFVVLVFAASAVWAGRLDSSGGDTLASSVVFGWSALLVGLIAILMLNIRVHPRSPQILSEPPEYATRWALPRSTHNDTIMAPFNASSEVTIGGNQSQEVTSVIRHSYSDTITLNLTSAQKIVLHRFYWKDWLARIDGHPIPVGVDSIGRVTLDIPEGMHTAVIEMSRPPEEQFGKWVSLGALCLLGLWLWWLARAEGRRIQQ